MNMLRILNQHGEIEYQMDVEPNSHVEQIIIKLFPMWTYNKCTYRIEDNELRKETIIKLTSVLQYNNVDMGISLEG